MGPGKRYIPQIQLDALKQRVEPEKVMVVYGPRRTGKTTLLNQYLKSQKHYLLVSGEDLYIQEQLGSQSIEKLKAFVGNHKLLVVDEAQKIANIGLRPPQDCSDRHRFL